MFEHTTHDTVAAAVYLHAYERLVGLVGVAHLIGMDFAILKLYAVGQLLHIGSGEVLVETHVIDLLLQETGMCQL